MKTILKNTIYFFAAVACAIAGSFGIVHAVGWTQSKAISLYEEAIASLVQVQVIREAVPMESLPLEIVYKKAAEKYGLPVVALKALALQESSNGKYLYRYEPHVYQRLKGDTEDERRMLASSHGFLHVMGFNAKPECGVHWSELYNPIIGIECGAKMLRDRLDRHKGVKNKSERMRLAFRDYNGSGEKAELHADRVMAKVGYLMFEEVE